MRGFKVTFGGQETIVAPEFNTGITLYNRLGKEYNVTVCGIDKNPEGKFMTYQWINTDMALGDFMDIEIVEIDDPLRNSDPISVRETFSSSGTAPSTEEQKREWLAEQLEEFHILEKLLQAEGLL